MHDPVSGAIVTARKEELLLEIEHQRKLGDTGLLEEDKYLAKVNLEEMEPSPGKQETLLATGYTDRTKCKNITGATRVPTNRQR